MTKVIFVTSGKITYTFPGHSLYESIYLTASGQKFPNLSLEGVKEVYGKAKALDKLGAKMIYVASSEQCLNTARIFSEVMDIPVMKDNNLLPLKFDLRKLLSEEEFLKLGELKFDVLRARFLESFYNDELMESKFEVREKFQRFRRLVRKKDNEEIVFAVSHAYIIKLFSIY